MEGLSLRCMFWPGEGMSARPLVHCRNEPTKLSLGMVASQQSPPPFQLESFVKGLHVRVPADSQQGWHVGCAAQVAVAGATDAGALVH